MKKLELKHLTVYQPYGLKIQNRFGDIFTLQKAWIENKVICINSVEGFGTFYNEKYPDEFKLMLRPMSDLSSEIMVDDKTFVPLVELLKLRYSAWFEEKKETRYAQIDFDNTTAWFTLMATFEIKVPFFKDDVFSYPDYWIIEKLFEWNFDVFGLIEAGYAIDINTLNK